MHPSHVRYEGPGGFPSLERQNTMFERSWIPDTRVTPSLAETRGNSTGLKKYTGYIHDKRPKMMMNDTRPSDDPYRDPEDQLGVIDVDDM